MSTIKPIEPPSPRADPQEAPGILCNGRNLVMRQTVWSTRPMLVGGKGFGAGIKYIKPIIGTHPQSALVILQKGMNIAMAQAGGLKGIISIQSIGIPIEFIESIAGTEPHKAFSVLEDTGDVILGEPLIGGQVGKSTGWRLCFA